ncbi:MAG TPA: HNH endonuclease [Terriglobales bacterium]|nr:HNH endonuclease [Terriglobales bacterium]
MDAACPFCALQRLGDTSLDFLCRIGWDDRVTRLHLETSGFDRRVHLQPGVREHVIRSASLLRPLIQQAWTNLIVKVNREATDDARLQEFLFGACRIALDPARQALRELQNNRCFYCDGRIQGSAQVDHFIPWVRHPDNGIENLVAADSACNNNKRDFLAAGEHLERWTERFAAGSSTGTQLVDIATRAGWERHSTRTLAAARTIYSRLPADIRLWRGRSTFVAVSEQREQIVASLALR